MHTEKYITTCKNRDAKIEFPIVGQLFKEITGLDFNIDLIEEFSEDCLRRRKTIVFEYPHVVFYDKIPEYEKIEFISFAKWKPLAVWDRFKQAYDLYSPIVIQHREQLLKDFEEKHDWKASYDKSKGMFDLEQENIRINYPKYFTKSKLGYVNTNESYPMKTTLVFEREEELKDLIGTLLMDCKK